LILADLSRSELERRLAGPGLRLRAGPVVAQIQSPLSVVAECVALHYAAHPIEGSEGFADFFVRIDRPRDLRRWLRPQAVFYIDGEAPFTPLPLDQAFALLEWGLNWCISAHCHQYLIVHAAVVARSGRALILPAPPGSGKSTLCAGLIHRGWRLLSDELALIDPATSRVVPLARPVSLKNRSIDVIRAFAPAAVLSRPVHDTTKGTVAHMRAPPDSVRRAAEFASPTWIVMPRYEAGATAALTPLPKARAFMEMVNSGFNYSVHGRNGFAALARVVDRCECHTFAYGDLEEAATLFDALATTS
jgi:HprK-related kinase A